MLVDNPVNTLLTIYKDLRSGYKFAQFVEVLYAFFKPGKKTG